MDRQRYIRLNNLIDSKFTDEQILNLLTLISDRADDEIQKPVTDNADIPTIFEYVLSIRWYKVSDSTNQRRMEMEPVSGHLGNYILRTRNLNSYCVFVTNELNINVVSDLRGRKNQRYYDTSDDNNFIEGMKIIPLQIEDLKNIVKNQLRYEKLYKIFESDFQSKLAPREWRNVCIAQILVAPFVDPQQKKSLFSPEKM